MKSIGILTFHHTGNYGGWLQAFALAQTLSEEGYRAEVIDYRPRKVHGKYIRNGLLSTRGFRWHLRSGAPFGQRCAGALRAVGIEYRQIVRMNRHLRELGRASAQIASTPSSLKSISGNYDTLITGSDEVWKMKGPRCDDGSYFLNVATSKQRCISYAASCGDRSFFGDLATRVRPWVERMDAVSVRDRNTRRIVSDEFYRNADEVVDPTWFLDPSFAGGRRLVSERYIALLGRPFDWAVRSAVELARAKGLIAVGVGHYLPGVDRVLAGLAPEEWLSVIRDAEYVVTNLYHGTLFCLRYGRPFVTACPADKKFKIDELLSCLDLEERIVDANSDPRVLPDILAKRVDFEDVWQRMIPGTTASREWLLRNV
ncbi:MAG: hypothetical protein RI897_561 [Verrucomicrobiota bacterium]